MTDPRVFLLAVATLLLMPGPTNTLLAMAGAARGIRRAFPLLAAELAGYLIAIVTVRLLLAPLLASVPAVGVALKIAMALYLVWLAVTLWRRPPADGPASAPVGLTAVFITTLLNPKALIFALAIFPQGNNLIWHFAGFAVAALVTGTIWIAAGALLGAAAGGRSRLLPRVAAVALVGFAAAIASSAV